VIATSHEIKSERLPLGDIILHDPAQQKDVVIFERKTLADLAASIRDGRYKEQSFRLIETATATGFHTHNIVYIIEGDLSRYDERHSHITKTALQSAMVSLMYYKGFSVVRTMNLGETVEFILNFADKVAKESADGTTTTTTQAYSEVGAKKEKRDYITRENIGEIMLAQVPGVSPKIAAAILAKYGGSIYEFLGDLHRKIDEYEESMSPEMSPPSPEAGGGVVAISKTPTTARTEPMNKNKYKHVSECFKDVTVDGKRGIGKLTVEKVCFFLG
jgi:ERCC4-type nuclease